MSNWRYWYNKVNDPKSDAKAITFYRSGTYWVGFYDGRIVWHERGE